MSRIVPQIRPADTVVTGRAAAHSISYVLGRTSTTCRNSPRSRERLAGDTLTKRRAVDFCRVATALCLAMTRRSQPAVTRLRLTPR
jgi:hypothetical protein